MNCTNKPSEPTHNYIDLIKLSLYMTYAYAYIVIKFINTLKINRDYAKNFINSIESIDTSTTHNLIYMEDNKK